MTHNYIKRETPLSYKKKKKSQMRCDPPHQMQRCWIELLFKGCKWVFFHCDAWYPIFPHRWKHMDSIQSLPYCFIYTIVSCLFFPSTRSTCLAHFDSVEIKKRCDFEPLRLPLCANFFTPTVLDYTTAIRAFNEARETTFPVKSIRLYSNGPDLFLSFFLLLRNKT